MALSGIGGATPSEEPKKVGGNDRLDENELKNQNKPNVSIWDSDGNGTVSVEEQRQAVETAISENKEIQEAIKLGFKVPSFDFKEIVTGVADKVTDSAMKEKVEEAIKQANESVQGYIDTVKDKAQVFIKTYNTLKSLGDKASKTIKNFMSKDKAEVDSESGDNKVQQDELNYMKKATSKLDRYKQLYSLAQEGKLFPQYREAYSKLRDELKETGLIDKYGIPFKE